jgi:hypothetical protein
MLSAEDPSHTNKSQLAGGGLAAGPITRPSGSVLERAFPRNFRVRPREWLCTAETHGLNMKGERRRPVLWGSQLGPAASLFCFVFFLTFFRSAFASGLVTVICELFFAPLPKRVLLNAYARRMRL